jgi:transcriptional regulator with XRE-family HTH domain
VILSRRLREVAAERGLALTHVADRAGVGRSHLWRLLNAEASATLDAVEKIAEALDVEPLALLTTRATEAQPIAAEPTSRQGKRVSRARRRR